MNFQGKQYPKEVILMTIRWYLAYPLSYRHVEEFAKERNIGLDHSTVQRWVQEYGPYLQTSIRKYLKKDFTRSWRLDETYVKVNGKWVFLYRITDSTGDTINFYLSQTRDHNAALECIRGAIKVAGMVPDKINSDGNQANEKAVTIINQELIEQFMGKVGAVKLIKYTKVKFCNNILEQDHRRIKRITNPMLGFKNFNAATDTIAGIEAIVMLRKNQSVFAKVNGRVLSMVDQYSKITA
jgi:putative transposase